MSDAENIRAKSGISDKEIAGTSRNLEGTAGSVSARHGKVSDNAGMKCPRSVEFPKLDVAGSTRSPAPTFIQSLSPLDPILSLS